jgi:aryl-alcohol dehydrogenase-like predicted oxidoreductase
LVLGRTCGEYVVGGAQLGLDYGLANEAGRPSPDQIHTMLAIAAAAGATTIDTAAAYGDSESVIGAVLADDADLHGRFWVITKLAPDVEDSGDPFAVAYLLREAVDASRRRLRQDRIPLLLLHRSSARRALDGALWETLRKLVDEGIIGGLGVSVYAPEEALDALSDPHVVAIQMPLSALDRRMVHAGVPDRCRERGVAVFARSIFLQGALAVPNLPPGAYPERLGPYVDRFHREAARLGRSGASLALAYVRAIPGLAGLVVGAETVGQVRDNVALFDMEPLSANERCELEAALGSPAYDLVDISRWSMPPRSGAQTISRAS